MAQSSTTPTGESLLLRAYGYIPNTTLAIVAGVVYIALGAILLFHVCRMKTWWGLCLPIGAICSGIGFFFRRLAVSHQDSKNILIVENVLISCMPALFLAFNYIVYGRLLLHTLGRRHTLIRPTIISTVFVLSDIFTFLIQATGGALLLSKSNGNLGVNIFKIGIILQACSYFVFIFLIAYTHWHVKREGIATGREGWWIVIWTLYFSSAAIVIRSGFRLAQQIEGKTSVLSTNEAYFYVLDVLALYFAIGVYIPWWPAKYMFKDTIVDPDRYKLAERPRV